MPKGDSASSIRYTDTDGDVVHFFVDGNKLHYMVNNAMKVTNLTRLAIEDPDGCKIVLDGTSAGSWKSCRRTTLQKKDQGLMSKLVNMFDDMRTGKIVDWLDADGDRITLWVQGAALNYYVNGAPKVNVLTKIQIARHGRIHLDGTTAGNWGSARVTTVPDRCSGIIPAIEDMKRYLQRPRTSAFSTQVVAGPHAANLTAQLDRTKRGHDHAAAYLATLQTRGNFTEIARVEAEVVSKANWGGWVDAHADDLMGGVPESSEAQVFQDTMQKALKGMKIGVAGDKQGEIVELDFTCKETQMIFGYVAMSVVDKTKNELHVVVSSHGKKWNMEKGHSMDRGFWEEHMDEVKAYCKHGALQQIKQTLSC